jgi:hypothetical protein
MKFAQNIRQKDKKTILKIIGGIILFVVGKKAIEAINKNSSEGAMDTDPAAGQAASIKQALNPSGFRWLRHIDGTDKEAILALAPQITDLDAVTTHFKHISDGDDMYEMLQGALSPEDYQKFLSLITKGKTGSWYYAPKSEKNVPANYWVISTAPVNIRSSPKNVHYLRIWDSNIVRKAVPKGKILGVTTGNFKYDEAGKVLFIEIFTHTKHGRDTYYVAKSQVEIISSAEKKKREQQGIKYPLELLDGISDNNSKKLIIANSNCPVYDEQFIQRGTASKRTILGFLIMELNTGRGKFIQIRTIQGLLRWIPADKATVRGR